MEAVRASPVSSQGNPAAMFERRYSNNVQLPATIKAALTVPLHREAMTAAVAANSDSRDTNPNVTRRDSQTGDSL